MCEAERAFSLHDQRLLLSYLVLVRRFCVLEVVAGVERLGDLLDLVVVEQPVV